MAKQGDWVLLRSIILQPGERAPQVPADTAQVPLVQFIKGWLIQDAELGQEAQVSTVTGRQVSGTLVETAPAYTHSFGSFVPVLQAAQLSIQQARIGEEQE